MIINIIAHLKRYKLSRLLLAPPLCHRMGLLLGGGGGGVSLAYQFAYT